MGWPVLTWEQFLCSCHGHMVQNCVSVCLWMGALWGKHVGSQKSWQALKLKCPPLWSYSSLFKVLQQPGRSNTDNIPLSIWVHVQELRGQRTCVSSASSQTYLLDGDIISALPLRLCYFVGRSNIKPLDLLCCITNNNMSKKLTVHR